MILDEAHLLNVEALTDIRLLISSALDHAPPLKVVLVGQEPLRHTLSQSSQAAARLLGFDLAVQLDPSEPALWDWLKRREVWEHTAERLLWRMLERTPAKTREAAFERAEAMRRHEHPSRAATLGWVLNRMQQPRRSLPLLKYAILATTAQAENAELKTLNTKHYPMLSSLRPAYNK